MPQAQSSIFNRRATERLRSPDDLDRFVRVTNPSVWVILAACLSLLVGLLAWGIFGSVTTSVTVKGACVGNQALCLLSTDEMSSVTEGDEAIVSGVPMRIATTSEVPISRQEAREALQSDYLTYTLMKEDWAYLVVFDGDTSSLAKGMPLEIRITTERVAPISLIMGGNA